MFHHLNNKCGNSAALVTLRCFAKLSQQKQLFCLPPPSTKKSELDFHKSFSPRSPRYWYSRTFLPPTTIKMHPAQPAKQPIQSDERNFRSTYYEKVGCRSVEEKKSLEILLNNKPINRIKLKQFCLRFTVPTVYRGHLWNLLLGKPKIHWFNSFITISENI